MTTFEKYQWLWDNSITNYAPNKTLYKLYFKTSNFIGYLSPGNLKLGFKFSNIDILFVNLLYKHYKTKLNSENDDKR